MSDLVDRPVLAASHASPSGALSGAGATGPLRLRMFFVAQISFLLVTPLTGGFHYKAWSMLDTALMLGALGMSALVPVLESADQRRFVLHVAIALYVLAVLDMCVNVVVSGVVGWGG